MDVRAKTKAMMSKDWPAELRDRIVLRQIWIQKKSAVLKVSQEHLASIILNA